MHYFPHLHYPPHCEIISVPTLSAEAARDTFYRIYKHDEQSNQINGILERLNFHLLSITLLATVAQHNQWDTSRLTMERERRRTGVLHTHHSRSLVTTIGLSLSSSMFQELGPDARELLEVVAFFPQGVNEKNIHWLFRAVLNVLIMLDKLCALSLTSDQRILTVLAPPRDHLRPKDPRSSSLNMTKAHYFMRLSGHISPRQARFRGSTMDHIGGRQSRVSSRCLRNH